MTDFEKAQETRDKLNAVSPSFCLAKWLQVSIHLPTGRTHSCYHPPSHKIPLSELKGNPAALHNTEFKMRERKEMLGGKRPPGCAYCWKVEDLKGDHLSDRHYRSAEDWAIKDFNKIKNAPWDSNVKPRYVEVNFNQACQFKCSYCSPQLSSSWMAEVKREGHFPTLRGHNRLDWFKKNDLIPYGPEEQNPYVEAFWKWWPKIYSHLRVFRMTGGEPLIDPNTFRVLEYAAQNPQDQLTLSLTSNMCPPESGFLRFEAAIRKLLENRSIKNFFLYASIDSVGPQAEYIRSGLDYKRFKHNVERYLAIPGAEIGFIMTFNALCVTRLRQYLKWIVNLRETHWGNDSRVYFDTPFLRSPEFMSLQILNQEWIDQIGSDILWAKKTLAKSAIGRSGLDEVEIAKLERVHEWMKEKMPSVQKERARIDFYLYFREHDRRRGTNFLKTFPELKDFWLECEALTFDFMKAKFLKGKATRLL